MPNIFISHVHAAPDGPRAAWLRGALEQGGLSVWQAETSLRAAGGSALNEEIAAALAQSQTIIVLLSAQFAASPYCRAEVIRAMELGRAIFVIDLEPLPVLPDALMPLSGYAATRMRLHAIAPDRWSDEIARGLAVCGHAGVTLKGEPIEISPEARIIHPPYSKLAALQALDLRSLTHRLAEAVRLNPSNGYLQVNLALVLLHQLDAAGAAETARRAVAQLPEAPDAHYALALSDCAAAPAPSRTHAQAEAILRRLAVARRLAGAAFHVDLLSAIVIANHHLVRYLTPPAHPEQILANGIASARRMDRGENGRVLDTELLLASPETIRTRELCAAYR